MIPIKNYGMLWERKYIHYGWAGVKGNLIGTNSRVEVADFREQIGIYVLYDKNMKAVYVGQAGIGSQRLFNRLNQHEVDHLWNRWEYFSWFGLRNVNKDGMLSKTDNQDRSFSVNVPDVLNEIEGVLIKILEPQLNRQGPKWKNVEEFFQEIDELVKETTLDEIQEKQDEMKKKIENILKKIQ